jgi:hydroxyethylthiazole kinase-like uncharacterized protein yjeF
MADLPGAVAGGTRRSPRLVTPQLLGEWTLPEATGTKYSRGQVLVVGGSRKTPGGVLLAGRSALRMGAGRLSVAVARSIAAHVAVSLPECGATPLDEDSDGSVTGVGSGAALADELKRADAVLVGPGLDDAEGAVQLVHEIARALPAGTPLVLDSYALSALRSVTEETRRALWNRVLLTPNTDELAILLGEDELDDEDVVDGVLEVSRTHRAVVACASWVSSGGRLWRITTGDTGLGTSGSGDVVAGATVGLLSRGAEATQALVWAKYVHASAGDDLVMSVGRVGYLASDLSAQLPRVLRRLGGN